MSRAWQHTPEPTESQSHTHWTDCFIFNKYKYKKKKRKREYQYQSVKDGTTEQWSKTNHELTIEQAAF